MTFFQNSLFSLSVVIPLVAGITRVKVIEKNYHPFLLLMLAGFINEVVSIWLAWLVGNNLLLYNFFALVETLFILWQFERWKIFGKGKRVYFILVAFMSICWIADSVFYHSAISDVNSYFIILSSFIIVIISIHSLTDRMYTTIGPLLKDSLFLINIGFIIYFFYSLVVEIFWLYGLGESTSFRVQILDIFAYINLFTNCLFALAILCMRTKPRYMVQW